MTSECKVCGKIHEGIGGYYDQKRCDASLSRQALRAAEEAYRACPCYEHQKALKRAAYRYDLDCYTGD